MRWTALGLTAVLLVAVAGWWARTAATAAPARGAAATAVAGSAPAHRPALAAAAVRAAEAAPRPEAPAPSAGAARDGATSGVREERARPSGELGASVPRTAVARDRALRASTSTSKSTTTGSTGNGPGAVIELSTEDF